MSAVSKEIIDLTLSDDEEDHVEEKPKVVVVPTRVISESPKPQLPQTPPPAAPASVSAPSSSSSSSSSKERYRFIEEDEEDGFYDILKFNPREQWKAKAVSLLQQVKPQQQKHVEEVMMMMKTQEEHGDYYEDDCRSVSSESSSLSSESSASDLGPVAMMASAGPAAAAAPAVVEEEEEEEDSEDDEFDSFIDDEEETLENVKYVMETFHGIKEVRAELAAKDQEEDHDDDHEEASEAAPAQVVAGALMQLQEEPEGKNTKALKRVVCTKDLEYERITRELELQSKFVTTKTLAQAEQEHFARYVEREREELQAIQEKRAKKPRRVQLLVPVVESVEGEKESLQMLLQMMVLV
jgi:hypothetical protein